MKSIALAGLAAFAFYMAIVVCTQKSEEAFVMAVVGVLCVLKLVFGSVK